jgi:hypothetical protein
MSSPIFADLDNSGHDELIVPAAGGKLIAYVTDATGNNKQFLVYDTGSNNDLMSTPIVVTAPSGRKEIFAGVSRAIGTNVTTPQDGSIYGWDALTGQFLPGWPQTTGHATDGTSGIVGALASGNLEGNGSPDIIATSLSNQVYAFRLDGSVLWSYNANDTISSGAVVGDLNGDGKLEVVFGSDTSSNGYFQNGGFINILTSGGQALYRYRVGETIWSSPVLADLNRDGKLEVVVGTGLAFAENSDPAISGPAIAAGDAIYAINGQGQGLPGWPYMTTSNLSQKRSTYSSPAVADLLGDGQMEVIEEDRMGYLHVVQANGQPLPGWAGGKLISPAGATPQGDTYASPIVADVTGSGHPEIVASAGAYIIVFDAQGNQVADLSLPNVPGAKLNAPAIGQYDENGGLELASVENQFGGTGYPISVNLWKLPSTSVTPPWPMLRRFPSSMAVQPSIPYLQSYVTGVFQTFLGRAPTSSELSQFVTSLDTLQYTKFDFANAIAASPTGRTHFADTVIRTTLNRAATPADEQIIVGALNRGATELDIEAAYLNSGEFAQRAGTVQNAIDLVYQAAFGRPAPASDINAWLAVFSPTFKFSDLVNQLLNSEESITHRLVSVALSAGDAIPPDTLQTVLYNVHRGTSEEQIDADFVASAGNYAPTQTLPSYVRTLYRDILGRDAFAIEVAYRMQQFDTGQITPQALAAALVNSTEGETQFVRQEFIALLGRDPGASASALTPYASREALIATLVASDEYFSKNGGNNTAFVQAAYRDIAGISPVPSDALSAWVNQLNAGTPRVALANGLLTSPAYYNQLVVADLFQYAPDESQGVLRTGLGNPTSGIATNPNPAVVSNLSGQLQAGVSSSQLVVNLLTLPSYIATAVYYKGLFRSNGIWS